jgi:acyl-coenzyme A synthetase/AMP-(fatty) acid ligase
MPRGPKSENMVFTTALLPTPRTFDDDVLTNGLDPNLVLPAMIRRWADEDPERAFMIEVGGRSVTYGEFWDELLGWVTRLQPLGVKPGDRVASLLPASIDAQLLWLASSCIGAWEVAVNPEFAWRVAAVASRRQKAD